ncbi:PAS domain S-box protein [Vineibacter terrae]|uniref:histidine kinase n=1 Tax=Vineibacter terrae TaxID=2586908 RepID=A0A5C8PUB3_9HYPH|nr:ATP-binding protein [Vineibacter terrae]TXL81674.1 PAS domain S-box protein [Vineibacter terrae]
MQLLAALAEITETMPSDVVTHRLSPELSGDHRRNSIDLTLDRSPTCRFYLRVSNSAHEYLHQDYCGTVLGSRPPGSTLGGRMLAFCQPLRAVALALLLCCAICLAPARAQVKHVLIIGPNTYELAASAIVTSAASKRLAESWPGKVEVFTEFLDSSRFSGQRFEQTIATYLSEKYAATPPDVILALGPQSLRFVIGQRSRIGPATPLVFCCISPTTLASVELPANAGGIISDFDLAKTMELAASLQPDARNVAVIAGSTAFDKQWAETARRQLAAFEPRYTFRYLTGLPIAQLLDELRRLPRNTIVIYTTMFADGAGRPFPSPRDIVPAVSEASRAPVYSPYDSYLDLGIVGGHMDTFEATGIAIADLALEAMAGGKLTVRPNSTRSYRVDWRQLQRWGLSETNLPAGTVILNKDPSFWERYHDVIIATAAAFALQTAVVMFLLVERRRRLHAEGSLRESEERMGSAAASVNVGLWQQDMGSGRLWGTDHCRAMFDIPAGLPLTREALLNAVHPDDQAAARRWLGDMEQSSTSLTGEFRVVLKSGDMRWYLWRSTTRLDDNGRPVSVSGVFSDITARKTAESEADSQRQTLAHITRVTTLGELSGAIAHEINQPLTAILANAQAARRMLGFRPPPLEEVSEALDDIITEDNRAGDVIRRLRTMLKKGEPRSEPVLLNDLVRSVLRLLRSELIDRRVNVDLDLADDLPVVAADQVQMQQVLTNLVMNAMDAVTSPGAARRRITIATAAPRPGYVETVVADCGPGLAADQQARLLEPFFTTKEHGLGLGLAICKSIVNAHGGVLSIVNAADRGVRASFTLPVAPAMAGAG